VALEVGGELGAALAVARGALDVADPLAQGGAVGQRGAQEPAEPHALAAALQAEAVHAVVPVAAADQRQAVGAAGVAAVERAQAVVEQRAVAVAGAVVVEALDLVLGEGGRAQVGDAFVEDGLVAAALEVAGAGPGEPQQVVAVAGAHAGAAVGVPPVQDVALLELARGGPQQLVAREAGLERGEVGGVLELVAEAVGAARLVQGRAAPHPAGERLVGEPAVEQVVDPRARACGRRCAEALAPARADPRQALAGRLRRLEAPDQRQRRLAVGREADHEVHVGVAAGRRGRRGTAARRRGRGRAAPRPTGRPAAGRPAGRGRPRGRGTRGGRW
jgi:hypothetical protein